MRNLSNAVAGVAGLVILLGALAATPNAAYGLSATTQDVYVAVPDLGGCQNLQVPAGNELAFHAYAEGVQIYRWDGMTWVFQAPEATLFADAGEHSTVGIHYAGPTWESLSGSKVVGRVQERCTPDPTAIPWLKLEAVRSSGPGVFDGVTYIQRVNTVGGTAPAAPGTFEGEVKRVPYTAEYFFYKADQ